MRFRGMYLGTMCLANRRCSGTCRDCARTLTDMFTRDRDFWLRTLSWRQRELRQARAKLTPAPKQEPK